MQRLQESVRFRAVQSFHPVHRSSFWGWESRLFGTETLNWEGRSASVDAALIGHQTQRAVAHHTRLELGRIYIGGLEGVLAVALGPHVRIGFRYIGRIVA